jgi:hypothetical protein
MAKTIHVEIEYHDRNSGPTVAGSVKIEAGSLPVGIAKALRDTWKTMDRKVRFDAAKSGLTIKAKVLDSGAPSESALDAE